MQEPLLETLIPGIVQDHVPFHKRFARFEMHVVGDFRHYIAITLFLFLWQLYPLLRGRRTKHSRKLLPTIMTTR
jgi:hypothetical protein